jgi:hypothetical protein
MFYLIQSICVPDHNAVRDAEAVAARLAPGMNKNFFKALKKTVIALAADVARRENRHFRRSSSNGLSSVEAPFTFFVADTFGLAHRNCFCACLENFFSAWNFLPTSSDDQLENAGRQN